jgi:hypothetical protein
VEVTEREKKLFAAFIIGIMGSAFGTPEQRNLCALAVRSAACKLGLEDNIKFGKSYVEMAESLLLEARDIS